MRTLFSRATRVLASRCRSAAAAADRGAAAVARASSCTVEALEARRLMASTYYVSPAGSNLNLGTSEAAPFRTISAINALNLNAGDRVLFQGGATLTGSLLLTGSDSGTATSPVTIGSYGTGRATLRTASGRGIAVENAGGIKIGNLNIVGTDYLATNFGIKVTTNRGTRRSFIRIDNVDVSGFGQHGISVVDEKALGDAGFNDVRITNAVVHHNVHAGIKVHSTSKIGYSHTNVYIGDVRAHDNFGSIDTEVSGSGIEISNVDGAMIERCVAFNNSASGQGAIGIWAHDSNRVTIQYNEVYDQHTTDAADGTGLGFDTNTSNSLMQYNWSHDNDGHGINLAQWRNNDLFTDNVVRFNIVQNNGRKNGYSGISMWGRVLNTHVYNNTIYQKHLSSSGSGPNRGIRIFKAGTDLLNGGDRTVYPDNVFIRNNIIMTTGSARLVEISPDVSRTGVDLFFQGNAYWTYGSTSPFRIYHNGVTYRSLTEWRAATGQETFNSRAVGFQVDPKLTNPGNGWTVGDPDKLYTMNAYQLLPTSPLIGQSLPVGLLGEVVSKDLGAGVVGQVPISNGPPAVVAFTASATALTFRFSESVAATLGRNDFVILDKTRGVTIPYYKTLLAYDASTHTATLTFPQLPGASLASGTYTVRMMSGGVKDVDGNRVLKDFVVTFTV